MATKTPKQRTYVVWEVEYPDGGSSEIRALTGREAKAKYRKMTGSEPEVELGAAALTPALRRERNNRAKANAKGLTCERCGEDALRCHCAAFVLPKNVPVATTRRAE